MSRSSPGYNAVITKLMEKGGVDVDSSQWIVSRIRMSGTFAVENYVDGLMPVPRQKVNVLY